MPQDAVEPLHDYQYPPANDAGWPESQLGSEASVFATASATELGMLVEAPCRALDVEYKSWRNLSHAEDRAELARDIAALANHGGGHVVFGFHEGTLEAEDNHPFWTGCTTEQIAAIVRDYLDPPMRCEVTTLRSKLGNLHPVVRVPGHGPVPVCVRRDGPMVGAERLIQRGAYYTRKYGAAVHGKCIAVPRPESGRIELPQEWVPLIRRCVRQDREGLLALIDAAIEGRNKDLTLTEQLAAWHSAAHTAFLALVPLSPVAEGLKQRHYTLSYGFELVGREMLEHVQLPELLRRAVFEQRPMFRDVLNMFDAPYRRAVQARFGVDAATGDAETEFLEVAWLRDRPPTETADFWRFSPRGLATIVRDYAEDRILDNRRLDMQPGAWFSPNVLAQELCELVCHARAMMRFFAGARRVCFRCEWRGLAGRELFDPESNWVRRGRAVDDQRIVTLQAPSAKLTDGWPDLVAELMAPVLRAFDPDLALGADWVRTQARRWQVNGTE
jgi:hypothetical protein